MKHNIAQTKWSKSGWPSAVEGPGSSSVTPGGQIAVAAAVLGVIAGLVWASERSKAFRSLENGD